MTTVEKSVLKFKREIKKAALLKQREITHQQERFIAFFEELSLEDSVQLVSYSEGQAYKQAIFRDTRSVLSPFSKKEICRELNLGELQSLVNLSLVQQMKPCSYFQSMIIVSPQFCSLLRNFLTILNQSSI